jgi:cyclomaltodextrinase
MVEEHSPEFIDAGERQKIDFFEGDVHLGHYDFRFDFNDKKHFSISQDGTGRFRVHTEKNISKLWLLLEDEDFRPVELRKYAETDRFVFWGVQVEFRANIAKFSFAATTEDNLNLYLGTSGIANFISPSEKWIYDSSIYQRHSIPDWVYGSVMYQVFPERFANGRSEINPENTVEWGSVPTRLDFQGGDLYGVIDKLDHIESLGVNILYLNPIFLSGSTHKYDSWDHFKVDPTLGGDDGLRDLISNCHDRNIKVILDCSLNHVHPRHFAFQDIVKNGENSEYKNWFTIFDYPVRLIHRPHLYANTYKVGWDGNEEEYKRYLEKTFDETKVPVEVRDDDGPIVEPSYKAWWGVPDMPKVNFESKEARQWALDVTKHWIENFDIDGWRMDVAKELDFSFWKEFRDIAHKANKDTLLISEIFGDTSQWLQGDRFDGTMNYSFREAMTDYFATKRINNKEFADSLANLYSMYSFEALSSCQNLLSSHDVKRFLNRCGNEEDGILGAIFLQATFPGIAGIYYGDEIGLGGADDPFNREPFPWHSEESWNSTILDYTKKLMNIKKSSSIFKYGRFELLDDNEQFVAFRRILKDESMLCIINRSKSNDDFNIISNAHSVNVIHGDCAANLDQGMIRITNNAGNIGIILHEQ